MIFRKCKKFLLALLLLPTPVFANNISLNCPKSANGGSTIKCSIEANISDRVDEIKILYKSDKVSFKSITPSGNWKLSEGGTESSKGFVLRSSNELTGKINLGTISYKLPYQPGNIDISIYGFDATNSSAQVVRFDKDLVSSKVHINDTNNYLKSLLINGESIGFNKDILTYEYTSKTNKINIVGQLDSNSSKCDNLSRTINLVNGLNTIEYKVVAENGSIKTYTLKVYYNKPSSNTNIISNTTSNDIESNITSNDIESNTIESNVTSNKVISNSNTNSNDNIVTEKNNNNILIYIIIGILFVGLLLILLFKRNNEKN